MTEKLNEDMSSAGRLIPERRQRNVEVPAVSGKSGAGVADKDVEGATEVSSMGVRARALGR